MIFNLNSVFLVYNALDIDRAGLYITLQTLTELYKTLDGAGLYITL